MGLGIRTALRRTASRARDWHWKRLVRKGLSSPLYLTHSVTTACDLQCAHCFHARPPERPATPLPLDRWETMIASLSHPLRQLSLTGGEPFLYPDLAPLVRLYADLNGSHRVALTSNGQQPDTIAATVAQIAPLPFREILLQLSLDGLRETHDRLRGKTGAFDQVLETAQKASALRKDHPHLYVNFLFVVHQDNWKEIGAVGRLVVDELGLPLAFELARSSAFFPGNPRLRTSYHPTSDQIALPAPALWPEVRQAVRSVYDREKSLGYDMTRARALLEKEFRIVASQKSAAPCQAGNALGYLGPDGAVSPCELLPPAGRLPDFGMDFPRLWRSPAMDEARKKIPGCFCSLGCFLDWSEASAG